MGIINAKESMGKTRKRNRLYSIYRGMLDRCYYSKAVNYKHYGARGITICDGWIDKTIVPNTYHSTKGWLSFKEWALTNGYADNLTIDRIDVNKDYSPNNCRWVTMKVQNNNARSNRILEYKGQRKTVSEWAAIININADIIYDRLNKLGWSVSKALETKPRTLQKAV